MNLAAESGDMGVLANHIPAIEQLKPGLVEVFEESGGSKQFFRMLSLSARYTPTVSLNWRQYLGALRLYSQIQF